MGSSSSRLRERRLQRRVEDVGKAIRVIRAFKSSRTTTEPEASRQGIVRNWAVHVETLSKHDSSDNLSTKTRDEELQSIQELHKHWRKGDMKLLLSDQVDGSEPCEIARLLEYDFVLEEQSSECFLCHLVKEEKLNQCRVCGRYCHRDCLYDGGFMKSDNERKSLEYAEQSRGWSCPQCQDMSQILSSEALKKIMHRFDAYDTDQDGVFDYIDFTAYESSFHRRKNLQTVEARMKEKETSFQLSVNYAEYDLDRDGIVSWEYFLLVEGHKLLNKVKNVDLIPHLKPKEVQRMRMLFKDVDKNNTGFITMIEIQNLIKTWCKTLGIGQCQVVKYGKWKHSERSSLISWDHFIRQYAVTMISARPNTATINPHLLPPRIKLL